MSYSKNIISNFLSQVVKIILLFIVNVIIARVLGPEQKGEYDLVFLIFSIISLYGHGGILNATTYFQKKSDFSNDLIYSNNITYSILNFVVILLAVLLIKFYGIYFINYSYTTIVLCLGFVLFTYLLTIGNSFYTGSENIRKMNLYFVVALLIRTIFILALYFVDYLTVETVVASHFLFAIIQFLLLKKRVGYKYRFALNKSLLNKEFKYGRIIFWSALFIYLNYRIDQFLVVYYCGKSSLGVYSVAVYLAELVFLIPTSIIAPLTGRLYNVDNDIKYRKTTSNTIKLTFYVTAIIALGGVLCSPLIKIIFGDDYTMAINIFRILVVGVLFASIGKVSAPYFFAKGKPQIHLLVTFIVLVMNVVFNIVFIPLYGSLGAAIASTISYALYGFAYVTILVYYEKFSLDELLVFSINDIRKVLNANSTGK